VLHWKFLFSMQQQERYLSQISLLPMLFPVNTILVHAVSSVFKVVLKPPTNLLLCAKHTSTLIVTLNFTAIPTLFLVLLPVHYHPVSICMWPNFGKSIILVHLTHSSQKQPLNLKFYAMVGWMHSRYIKLQGGSQKYSKSILCSWQYQVKHKNSNCFVWDEMVDFPKFGHI